MTPRKPFLITIVIFVLIGYLYTQNKDTEYEEFHIHYDLRIVVDGVQKDLSHDSLQTETAPALTPEQLAGIEQIPQSNYDGSVNHLHNNDGKVVHVHEKGQTIGDFLNAIGFSNGCLPYEGTCQNIFLDQRVFVNSKEVSINYIPKDLDKVLIVVDSIDSLESEIELVTDEACIHSGKCREKGEPKPEQCGVGGGGCAAPEH